MNALCNNVTCPSETELRRVMDNKEDDVSDSVTECVGSCSGCQNRIETLATEGDQSLPARLKGIEKRNPPSNSAYWAALGTAEKAITMAFNSGEADLSKGVSLQFLQPSNDSESLGRIRHFEVRRVIGKGGMGVVLHAYDSILQRDVAVKVLDPSLSGNVNSKQRFSREARAAAAVTHENIVAVHQVDEDEFSGMPYIIMQLVMGESLETKLTRQGKLPIADVVRYGMQIANGLAAAHTGGLVHRDIKPGNILIEENTDKALLTDFGLARGFEDVKLTRTGFVAGTPLYMAPEQARGDAIDNRVDLYGLGAILYEALAGKPPFDGVTPLQVLRRITDDQHKPVRELNNDVPEWLEHVVDKLLAKNPADRYQSATEVAAILSEHAPCVDANTTAFAPPECGPVKALSRVIGRKRRPRVAAALYLGAAFAIGGLGASVLSLMLIPPTEKIVEVEKPVTGGPGNTLVATAITDLGAQPNFTLKSQGGGILSLAIHKDSNTIATGSEDGQIRIWDKNQQKIIDTLKGHKGSVYSVDYSPDAKRLVSASDDGTVKIWDLEKSGVFRSFTHPTSVRAAMLHQSGQFVVTGDRSGLIALSDLSEEEEPVQLIHGSSINAVALSPDGLTIASAGVDGKVILWEVPPKIQRKRYELNGHLGPVYSLSFSPDGAWLVSSGWDGTVIIWDVNQNRKIKEFKASTQSVWTTAFTPCQGYLATGSQDGVVKIWMIGEENEPVKEVQRFARHKGPVNSIRFSTVGGNLAAGGQDGSVFIWTLNLPKCQPAK